MNFAMKVILPILHSLSIFTCEVVRNRGSYMSAHVLLNFIKRDGEER